VTAITPGARSVLSFVTSQAFALSQVKVKDGEPTNASQDNRGAAPWRGKSLFKSLFKALVKPRMPKHRRRDRDGTNT
jgi:hypothetical protein